MTNLLYTSLAYKAAVVSLFLGEASYFERQLNLPDPTPIPLAEVKIYVSPPKFGFGGTLMTTNCFFSFNANGKLWTLGRMNLFAAPPFSFSSPIPYYDELAKTPSLIDKKGAYQLATQWLSAVSVDVGSLEKKYPRQIYQWFFYKPQNSTNKIDLPIYEVKWGDSEMPVVKVSVLGTTKKLMELRMEDDSFSRRRPLVITNVAELNNRPDPVIKQLQRSSNFSRGLEKNNSNSFRTNQVTNPKRH